MYIKVFMETSFNPTKETWRDCRLHQYVTALQTEMELSSGQKSAQNADFHFDACIMFVYGNLADAKLSIFSATSDSFLTDLCSFD